MVFAVWVWAIYFTFPGTYSTQVNMEQWKYCKPENYHPAGCYYSNVRSQVWRIHLRLPLLQWYYQQPAGGNNVKGEVLVHDDILYELWQISYFQISPWLFVFIYWNKANGQFTHVFLFAIRSKCKKQSTINVQIINVNEINLRFVSFHVISYLLW